MSPEFQKELHVARGVIRILSMTLVIPIFVLGFAPTTLAGEDACHTLVGEEKTRCLLDEAADLKVKAIKAHKQGDLEKSAAFMEKHVAILVDVFGEKHPSTLRASSTLATLYHLTYHDDALPLGERTLALRIEVLGESDPDTLASMQALADAYSFRGRHRDALRLTERAFSLRTEVLGKKHRDTLATMSNLAAIYRGIGRYRDAAELDKKTLALRTEVLGEKHLDTLVSLSNLAVTYIYLDRYQEALKLESKVFATREEVLGEKHPSTLNSMNNLTLIYSALGRHEEALKLAKETLASRTELLGEHHPDTLMSMSNLAAIYKDSERYEDALAVEQKTLEIRRRVLGETHPRTLASASKLAVTYGALGRHEEALSMEERNLAALNASLGENHPDTLSTRQNLVETYLAVGQSKDASGAFEVLEDHVLRLLSYQVFAAEEDVHILSNVARWRPVFDLGASLSASPASAFASALSWQGLATRAEQQWRDQRELLEHATSEQRATLETLRHLTSELRWIENNPPADRANLPAWKARLEARKAAIQTTERKARAIPGYSKTRKLISPSPTRICRRLREEGASLLQFMAYEHISYKGGKQTRTPRYAVFSISPSKKGCDTARADVDASALDQQIATWRASVHEVQECFASTTFCSPVQKEKAHQEMHEAGKALRGHLWTPFREHLRENTVYIVPDGRVNQVSFASLANEKDTFLIEEKTLRYLPYAAALDTMGREREGGVVRGALFVGNLDYNRGFRTAGEALGKWRSCTSAGCGLVKVVADTKPPETREDTRLMGTQACGYGTRAWSMLETKVDEQASFFASSTGEETLLVQGAQAHEAALREKMHGKRLLHLATHGFYSPREQCTHLETPKETRRGLEQPETMRAPRFGDPLELSALVLSGGNHAADKLDNPASDGLLSAREVVELDLRGTKVVTLAACETGLGDHTVGEGSLGLARAFLVAGAETTLVSHWQVPLADTNALFQRFYASAFPTGKTSPDVVDAYHRVVRETIQEHRDQGRIHSAFFWAAFFTLQIQ